MVFCELALVQVFFRSPREVNLPSNFSRRPPPATRIARPRLVFETTGQTRELMGHSREFAQQLSYSSVRLSIQHVPRLIFCTTMRLQLAAGH